MTGKIIQFPSLDDSDAAESAFCNQLAIDRLDDWMRQQLNNGLPAKSIAAAIARAAHILEVPHEGEIE